MPVPYTFGTATSSIPLSQLDSNFATAITIGNTAVQLGNTVTTLNNLTLANVTISSGNVTITNVTVTTANATTANVGTLVVTSNATVGGNVSVTGNVSMNVATITTANVSGTANVQTLVVTTNETVLGNTSVTGNVTASINVTGAKLIPTGSSVTGNGLYLPAANALGLSTNGVNAVYIDASQNVGIGTASPTTILHTVGANATLATTLADSVTYSKLRFQNASTSSLSLFQGVSGSSPAWYFQTANGTGTGSYDIALNPFGGNVGIGTASPAVKTEVSVNAAAHTSVLRLSNQSTAGYGTNLDFYVGYASGYVSSQMFSAATGTNGGYLTFNTKADGGSLTERMRIDSSGNVGIGTSSPSFISGYGGLQINGGGNGSVVHLTNSTTGTTSTDGFDLILSQGSSDAYVWQRENAPLIFGTNATERMRLDSSGNLLVGTTTAGNKLSVVNSTANTDTALIESSATSSPFGCIVKFSGTDPNNATSYVYGAYASTSSTWIYRIYSNGTVAARSDARFKKNIETARDGYAEDLNKLRVVKYHWYNNDDNSPKELGLIAQEVEQVFPNLVQTDTSESGVECKSIKVSVLPIMLLKAIQEQQALIQTLTDRITALEGATK